VSESAVSDKPLLIYGLARNRRSLKRPSEPRPSGVHPEEDAVGGRREATLGLGLDRGVWQCVLASQLDFKCST
jgi:hypothetical protein